MYKLIPVLVWPDGLNILQEDYNENDYNFISDDYEKRNTYICSACGDIYSISYAEPIASCSCHSTEWYL
jgi:rubrerythrin